MGTCPGCGAGLPAAARFCPGCGRTVAAAAPPPPPPGPSGGDADKRRIALAAAAGLTLILLAVFLLVRAGAGVLSARKPQTGTGAGVLTAPPTQTATAPVLTAPAPQAPPQAPVLTPPQVAARPMPRDVYEYLRWLKAFENRRRQLEYQGMAEMTVFTQKATTGALQGFLNPDAAGEPADTRPEDDPVAGIGKVIQDWNALTREFQQRTPPDECAALATEYNRALAAGVAQMSALQGMLTNALASIKGADNQATQVSKDTLAELYRQKSTRAGSLDVDTAYRNADTALDAIRNQYTSVPDDVGKRAFDIRSGGGELKLPFMGI